ncbi:hypothetical protein AVEN_274967-1 [Araneus ventricosus]|uniref:Uncharacterized protein n=1 Tax=Araneus ventricosus TaxID=182803 RepID=A0A4Y2V7I1_ARAVE|nr:hypothetical protein AVEN_274967-1 [Araneus ventricosus]
MRKSRQSRAVENVAQGHLISMGERVAFFFRVSSPRCSMSEFRSLGGAKFSAALVTLAPLDKDCTVTVAPEENEVSPSTSQIDVSIQSIVPFARYEQRGAKRKRKSQKSKIMTSSPFKNLLEKNEKEKIKLEEAKANRAVKKNKNGDKTEKEKALIKEKFILNSIEKPRSLNKFGKE